MDYKPIHKKNFLSEKPIMVSALTPGVITTFNYVDEDKVFSKQLVLILNPRWRNNLHGLSLEFIKPKTLQEIAFTVKLRYSSKLNEIAKLRLPLINVNVGNPKSYYHAIFKHIMESKLRSVDCYREFVVNRMTNIKIVEYAFLLQEQLDHEAEIKRKKQQVLLKKIER